MIDEQILKGKLSVMIDSIIEDCNFFESPMANKGNLNQNYSKVSLLHDQLLTQNFNPNSVSNLINSVERSKKLERYIERKVADLSSGEDFQKMIRASPTEKKRSLKNSPSNFTFENVKEGDISQILLKNKRGFGQGWGFHKETIIENEKAEKIAKNMMSKGYFNSFINTSPERIPISRPIKLPSHSKLRISLDLPLLKPVKKHEKPINSQLNSLLPQKNRSISPSRKQVSQSFHLSPIENPFKTIDSPSKPDKLGNFINKLLEKNLGIRNKPSIIIEDFPIKRKESQIDQTIPEGNPDECGYLNAEYIKYNENVPNKLKIQKILVAKHQQHRRQTLWNFPPIKKSKNPDL